MLKKYPIEIIGITGTVESFSLEGANLIFVDYQNFAGLLGHKFMGYWFAAFQFKTAHNFDKHPWGRKFLCKGKSQNPPPLISHKQ